MNRLVPIAAALALSVSAAQADCASPETFRLRGECDALSKNLLSSLVTEDIALADATKRTLGVFSHFTENSRYDPVSGHCYSEIDHTYGSKGVYVYSTAFYDAQTKNMLAFRTFKSHQDNHVTDRSDQIYDPEYCGDRFDVDAYMAAIISDRPKPECNH